MKKLFSVILILILVISTLSFNSFAMDQNDQHGEIDISLYSNSELDLSQYTMKDLFDMSANEYLILVKEFERVYNPYNSYIEQENESANISMVNMSEDSVSLQWKSGDITKGEYTKEGCHEYITATACNILTNDRGFFADNATAAVVITLSISLASLLPDKDEVGFAFAGHFYDPDTGKNYMGSTTDTAKVHAQEHFEAAVDAANDDDMDEAFEHLGRCLHYVQDACVPHHAANNRNIIDGFSHGQFEDFAFSNQKTYLGSYTSIPYADYTAATHSNISTLTHEVAVFAKSKISSVNDTSNKSQWPNTAAECLKKAAKYSAMVMYRFSRENAVEFY